MSLNGIILHTPDKSKFHHAGNHRFHHNFRGLDRPAVLSARHRDPAVENGSCSMLFFLSASADRDLLMAENGISRLLGDFRYFGCRLLHFDPAIVSDRPDLEYRRYRPIFQKTNRIQRIAAGIGATDGLDHIHVLSPVRLRSGDRWRGVLNELFFRPDKVIFLETVPFSLYGMA